MRSITFIERMKSIRIEEKDAEKHTTSTDKFDAFICASLAYDLEKHSDEVAQPDAKFDDEEGWIFAPGDCLNKSVTISYGRLLISQSPPKPLPELLSQIQVGLILELAMKASKKKSGVDRSLVECALKQVAKKDEIFQTATAASLRALFTLLHPKAKTPTDRFLETTATRLADKTPAPAGEKVRIPRS